MHVKMSAALTAVFLTLVFAAVLPGNANAATNVSDCGTLSIAGTYYMLNATFNATAGGATCLTITANNVTLDCASYYITNNGTATTAVLSTVSESTIKNCFIYNFTGPAVNLSGANYANISNNTLIDNQVSILLATQGTTIYNNSLVEVAKFLRVKISTASQSTYLNISENYFNGTGYGIYAGELQPINRSLIYHNTFYGGQTNVYGFDDVMDCAGAVMDGSIANTGTTGSTFFEGGNVTIKNCIVRYNGGLGLDIDWFYNNTVTNCTVSHMAQNMSHGILVVGNNSNVSYNTVINSTVGSGSKCMGMDRFCNGTFHDNKMRDCYLGFVAVGPLQDNVFYNNVINNTNVSIRFQGSKFKDAWNNTFYNNIINNTAQIVVSLGRYAYQTFWRDSTIANTADGAYDVAFTSDNSSLTFTNMTFNKSAITLGSGVNDNFTIKWYADVHVINSTGDNVTSANVNISNVLNTSVQYEYFNVTTNSTGWIPKQDLSEFYQDNSNRYALTPHYIVASKSGYVPNTTTQAITSNGIYTIVLSPASLNLSIVSPTLADGNVSGDSRNNWIYVNASYQNSSPIDTEILSWNGTNETNTMDCSSGYNCWINKTGLVWGNYTFYVWMNLTDAASNQTATRWNYLDICGTLTASRKLLVNVSNATSQTNCFTVTADSVTLDCQGFTVDGTGNANGAGVYSNGNDYLTVQNCKITGFGYAIRFGDGNNNLIWNNAFYNTAGSPIDIEGSGDNYTVFNNTFYNTDGLGIYTAVASHNYFNISYNTFNKISSTCTELKLDNSNVHDNVCFDSSSSSSGGIYLSSPTSGNNSVYNNRVWNNSIAISGDYTHGRIFNNTLLNNTQRSLAVENGIGIRLLGGYDVLVFGNTIYNNTVGIQLNGSSNSYVYSNNVSYNSRANTIFHCRGFPLCSIDSKSNTFLNNTLVDANYGVIVFGWSAGKATNNSFNNNSVSGAKVASFYFTGASNNTVVDSTLAANYGGGGNDVISTSAANNTFVNVSFDKKAVTFVDAVSNITVKWYTNVHVTDLFGNNVAGANVNISNTLNTWLQYEALNLTANATGWIPRQNVTEYSQNSSAVYNFTPHNIVASKNPQNLTQNNMIAQNSVFTIKLPLLAGCGTLNTPNTYFILAQNVTSPGATCFIIVADNVTLDCAQHSIAGNGAPNTYGVFVNVSNNSIIKNCIITNFAIGVYVNSSFNSTISTNNISYNAKGIRTVYSYNGTIADNVKILGTSDRGIDLFDNTDYFMVRNNSVETWAFEGIFVGGTVAPYFSEYNTIYNNTINLNASTLGQGGLDSGFRGRYNNFSYNTITATNYGYGIVNENSNSFDSNVITTANGFGINSIFWDVWSNFSNNRITSGNTSLRLSANAQQNDYFYNNVFTSTAANATELLGPTASGNNFSSNTFTGNDYGIYFSQAPNNNFIDSTITGGTRDLFFSGGSNGNLFINSTFNKSDVNVLGASNFTVMWYLGIRVVDGSNLPVSGATVNATDVNGTLLFTLLTAADGYITTQTVSEYSQNSTAVLNRTPHLLSAFKNPTNSTQTQVTQSGNVVIILGSAAANLTISNVHVIDVTQNTVTIGWDTNPAANETIEYGLDTSYGSTYSNAALATTHSAFITSLTTNTPYHYRIKACNAAGNCVYSGDYNFTTAGGSGGGTGGGSSGGGYIPAATPTIAPSAVPSASEMPTVQPSLIGGDKDAHGCLIAAGYSWCEAKQKCLRTWEEPCVAASVSPSATATVVPQPAPVSGSILQWLILLFILILLLLLLVFFLYKRRKKKRGL